MIIETYNDSHMPLLKRLIDANQGVFEGWRGIPNLHIFQTYVAPDHGMFIGEALGSGNYLWSAIFLPESKGVMAGKAQMLMMDKAFMETDMVTAWGVAEVTNQEGYRNVKHLGDSGFDIPFNRRLSSSNFIRWASTSKSLEREALKYWEKLNVFPPHWVMLYAVLKTCHLGWHLKALGQWYIYERVATLVPDLKPLNGDFKQFFYDGMVFEWEKVW